VLIDVNLRGASMTYANLYETDMRKADIRGTDVRKKDLLESLLDDEQITYLDRFNKQLEKGKVYS